MWPIIRFDPCFGFVIEELMTILYFKTQFKILRNDFSIKKHSSLMQIMCVINFVNAPSIVIKSVQKCKQVDQVTVSSTDPVHCFYTKLVIIIIYLSRFSTTPLIKLWNTLVCVRVEDVAITNSIIISSLTHPLQRAWIRWVIIKCVIQCRRVSWIFNALRQREEKGVVHDWRRSM